MFHKNIVCCYLYPITLYGYPPPADNTLKYIDEMAALGFRSIELEAIHHAHLDQVYEMKQDIREKLKGNKVKVPFFCVVLPGLSDASKIIRKKNLRLFEKGCEIAASIGSQGVLDNGPLPPYRFPGSIPVTRHYEDQLMQQAHFPARLSWNRYWPALADTYREACDVAASFGLSYHLHPAAGVLTSNTDGFLVFADAVNRDNLRFTPDTANQHYGKENLFLALMRLAGRVDYIHLSDNRGQKIEHLPPGQGKINWDTFFEALKKIGFNGHIGLDIGGAESGVANLDKAYIGSAQWLEASYYNKTRQL